MQRFLFFIAGLCFAIPIRAIMIINGDAPPIDYDYYNRFGTSFHADAYDWSGVSTGSNQRATMVSPSYFVTATHFAPGVGTTLTFENPSGVDFEYDVIEQTILTTDYDGNTYNSDLTLGKLDSQVDPSVAFYAVPHPSVVFPNDPVLMYGRDEYVGRNAAEDLAYFESSGRWGVGLIMYYNDVQDEAFLQQGDSSSPTMRPDEDAGELVLLGTHSAIGGPDENWPDHTGPYDDYFSVDTYIPFYIDQINSIMVGEQLTVIIPEPASVFLLIPAFLIFGSRKGLYRCVQVK